MRRPPSTGRGMVLLVLLITLALIGIGLMVAVDMWSVARLREREQELLWVGDQYRSAIRRYYLGAPPGSPRVLPATLDALLDDERYPVPAHHIRRLFADPMTGKAEWGLLLSSDRIYGVYSLSEAQPTKQAGFPPLYEQFKDKTSYREWAFAFVNQRRSAPVPSSGSSAPSGGSPFPIPTNP